MTTRKLKFVLKASVVTREAFFESGLVVLADLGYGGLKLAEVCNRLGVKERTLVRAVYLLVGYEQSRLPPDTDGLAWIVGQLLEALDSGRFKTVPGT